jgi:trehalose 6-phosphate phosphatase
VDPVSATIDALAADPARSALLVDYDGSLSPIVLHPEDAVPLPGTVEVLERIAERLHTVAVVSGRPVDFLIEHVPAPRVQLIGQYGLEWAEAGRVVADPRALEFVGAVADAAAEAHARWPDLFIERKGQVSVGVHWRQVGAIDDAEVAAIEALGHKYGLEVLPSRKAREFRPPIDTDKGTVVTGLVGGMTAAAFAGDDSGDVPAFVALERLRAAGNLAHAFRVAVTSSETPQEVRANADVVVDGPPGLRALLDRLAAAL